MCARASAQHVVLRRVEHRRTASSASAARAQPPGHRLEQVLLAEGEQLDLPGAVEQVGLVVAAGAQRRRSRCTIAAADGPLEHRLDGLLGDEAGRAERVEVAELVAVAGQQLLGHQLQQDGVVALEGGEDVGVGLQRRQPVLGQVARAAARLPAGLDGVAWRARSSIALMPAARRLQLAPAARRLVAELGSVNASCSAGDQLRLREVQRVGAWPARGSSLRWWAQVVEQRRPRRRRRARRTAGAPRRSARRWSARPWSRCAAEPADADPALDQRAEHGEEAAGLVLDRRRVACRRRRRRRSG